jgi:catechol-2,3-dioxygenase
MPKPIRFSHAVLKTYDVAKLRQWYCDALEARVVFEKLPKLSFVAYDQEHHRLAFAGLEGEPVKNDPRAPGLVHTAFTYANVRDLLAQYVRMRSLGFKPIVTVNHGPTLSFYYLDPDGNGVEFLVDRFPTAEDAQAFIDRIFDRNPAGIDVEPEELLERMHAGATDEELLHYDLEKAVDPAEVVAKHRSAMRNE